MNEDKRVVDELVQDVQESLKSSFAETQVLLGGLSSADDPEGEGLPAVTQPAQIERLWRLRSVLGAALADLP